MGLVVTTKTIYPFIFDKNGSNDTKIIQYCIMPGMGLCINFDSFVAHMFYA